MGAIDKHKEMFKEEAQDLLAELEVSLLELEERPDDQNIIGKVFRAMHTIKGSGGMFGFEDIVAFTHGIETVYDLIRNGKLAVTNELINITLGARDCIREMLEDPETMDREAAAKISASFKKIAAQDVQKSETKKECAVKQIVSVAGEEDNPEITYRISFKPPKDIFLRGLDPVNMVRELIELGWGKVVAQVADIPFLEELDTDSCYTYWDVILTTNKGINAIKDVFIFIEDDSEIRIDVIHTEGDPEHGAEKKLGEILIERGHVDHDTLQKVLGEKKLIGEILIDAGIVPRGQVEAALAEQRQLKEIQDKKKTEESASSIRVASDKLDKLVNLVGELVTVQSRLSQTAAIENNITFSSIAEEVERLTTDLRDTTMNIRMLPIGSTFTKFRRLVRDLSQELGKEIEIETEGAETELDKTVIEKLNDPMVHLIRNSIDHGIELPRDRVAAGKSPKGTIHLSALHSGAFVLIRIKDDGGGLNTKAIRAKAIEKGLITQGQELSDKEIYALILAPGFSTAQKVTNVSGRGVGMDVVKQAIDALRGTIEIDSELGIGTTITLRLPLTLAIIDGFLIKVATEYFVLPLASVAECMELTCNQALHAHGRNIVNVRESIVPFIRLRDIFRIAGERPAIEHLVITETENGRIGIVADNIIGEHQTVIKNLGTMYRGINCLSGATILGDGTVALILDVQQISGEEIRKEQIVTRN